MSLRYIRIAIIAQAAIILFAAAISAQEKVESTDPQACPTCHDNHKRSYEMWAASAHGKAPNPVTCTACHKAHDSKLPHHLTMDAEDLCSSCHQQRAVLQGRGAKGLDDDMRSYHSGVECISCHMSEGNHLMKVIRPDDPAVSEKSLDTCTSCHKDNNRKARAEQLQQWQSSYKETMERLQADLKAIGAAVKEKPTLLDQKTKTKLDNVKFNLQILEKDGSLGAHNHDFATYLMSLAEKDLKPIKTALKLK